jgi:Flp pilus assembly protein TadD
MRRLLLALLALTPLALAHPARAEGDPIAEALAAAAKGEIDVALEKSEAAVVAEGATARAWVARGYVLSKSGRKEEALVAYEKAGALDPKDVLSRLNRASVLLALGRAAESLSAADEAAGISPTSARAQNHRGVALERLNRLDESRAAYRAAIRLGPSDAVPRNNLGALAFRRGVEGAAAAHFAKAIELDPSLDAATVNASLVLSVADKPQAQAEAEDGILASAARAGATDRVRARAQGVLGDRAARARRWAEAKAHYLEQLALDPDDAAALNNLGVAEDQLGESREALTHFLAASELRPEDVNLRNNIGVVHVHRNDYDSAEAVFREVLRGDARFHRAWHNLGVVLGAKGDRAGASAAFRRAAELFPLDASTIYNLAILDRDRRHDPVAERRAFEQAVTLDPSLAEAHLSLGTLLCDPGSPAAVRDEAKARTHLQRFLALAYEDDYAGRKQATDWIAWLDAKGARK